MDPLKVQTIELRPGQVFTATAQVLDQDGNVMEDQEVTWKTSNPSVAAPGQATGITTKIWGKQHGQATLTAACGTAFQTVQVVVVAPRPERIVIIVTDPK